MAVREAWTLPETEVFNRAYGELLRNGQINALGNIQAKMESVRTHIVENLQEGEEWVKTWVHMKGVRVTAPRLPEGVPESHQRAPGRGASDGGGV